MTACASRPAPSGLETRACYVGVVPAEAVVSVQAWAPLAQEGDLLITPACDEAQTERVLNAIRRETR